MAKENACTSETEVISDFLSTDDSQTSSVCTKKPIQAEAKFDLGLLFQPAAIDYVTISFPESMNRRDDPICFYADLSRPLYLSLGVLLI